MKLRDHVEMAVLLARLAAANGHPLQKWPAETGRTFWNQVHYLEHLWSKEMDRAQRERIVLQERLLVEEILSCRLFVQSVSAMTLAHEEWSRHRQSLDRLLLEFDRPETVPSSLSRLFRLRKRLDHWGDFLVSRLPGGEEFSEDRARCREFHETYQLRNEAVWELFLKGITRTVPARSVEEPIRSGIYRLLHEAALKLIPENLFLTDGRLKPHWRRRIEAGAASWS